MKYSERVIKICLYIILGAYGFFYIFLFNGFNLMEMTEIATVVIWNYAKYVIIAMGKTLVVAIIIYGFHLQKNRIISSVVTIILVPLGIYMLGMPGYGQNVFGKVQGINYIAVYNVRQRINQILNLSIRPSDEMVFRCKAGIWVINIVTVLLILLMVLSIITIINVIKKKLEVNREKTVKINWPMQFVNFVFAILYMFVTNNSIVVASNMTNEKLYIFWAYGLPGALIVLTLFGHWLNKGWHIITIIGYVVYGYVLQCALRRFEVYMYAEQLNAWIIFIPLYCVLIAFVWKLGVKRGIKASIGSI